LGLFHRFLLLRNRRNHRVSKTQDFIIKILAEEHQKLEGLCEIIEALSVSDEKIEFVNLRAVFVQKLASKSISNYLPKSAIRVVLDAVLLKNKTQIDQKACERGLYFTLDGVHLNSAGAEIVSEIFLKTINGERQL
jgi:hypothetical protein